MRISINLYNCYWQKHNINAKHKFNEQKQAEDCGVVLSEQSDSIKVWGWALVRSASKQFPNTLTRLTLHYDKLIKSPQVSYFKCQCTKTSPAPKRICTFKCFLASRATSGLCGEKWFCNIKHSNESSCWSQIRSRLAKNNQMIPLCGRCLTIHALSPKPFKHYCRFLVSFPYFSVDEWSLFPLVQ